MKRLSNKLLIAVLVMVAALCLFTFAACAKEEQASTTVTVSYDGGELNGETSATFQMDAGGDLGTALAEYEGVAKNGYTFAGWNMPEKVDGKYAAEITVTAKWTAVSYTITYNYDGGALPEGQTNPATYTIEQDVTFVAPQKVGYDFAGYVDGSDNPVTGITKGTTGNMTVKATWTKGKTTVTVDFGGGKIDEATEASFTIDCDGDLEAALADYAGVAKTGYTFASWTLPEKTDGFYAKEVTVTANWTAVNYSITYDYGEGGALPEGKTNPSSYTIEQDVTFVAPQKTGYTFKGFKDANGNTVTDITKGTTGDLALTATWDVIKATVNFYLPGGEEPLKTSVFEYNTDIALPQEVKDQITGQDLVLSGLLNEDGTPFTVEKATEEVTYNVILDVYNKTMTFAEGNADDYETEAEITYNADGFYTATVTGNNLTALYYPNYYNGKPVEVILDSTQVNNSIYFAALTSAYIPANVKLIWNEGTNANYFGLFHSAEKLDKVTFGAGSKLQEIHDVAMFKNTAMLKTVALPDSIEVIFAGSQNGIFSADSGKTVGLTSFSVPKALKKLPQNTFSGATALESFIIPEGSQLTEMSSFGGEYEKVTELDFSNATKLVKLPTLSGFYNVATFKFPASLQEIGTFAGSQNKNDKVTSIDLSGTQVEELGANTFANLPNLAEVKFPATLTTIGLRLFGASGTGNDNTKITELDFSGTQLAAVPELAFAYMSGLTTVKFPATLKQFGTLERTNDTTLKGANNTAVFYESTNVTTVVFGGALDVLGDFALYNLGKLGDITVEIAANGQMGSHVFANAGAASATITVKLGAGATAADSAFMFTKALNLNLQGFASFGNSGITAPESLDSIAALSVTTNAVATIANYPALYGSLVANVTFDEALTELKGYAFALSRATPVFAKTEGVTYGGYLFYKSSIEKFDFTNTPFKNVTEKMFYGSAELDELAGWDTLETVETGAFVGTSVTKFEIGKNLTYVNPEAFTSGTVTYDVGSTNSYYEKATNDEGDTEYILYKKDNKVSIFYDVKMAGDEDFERDFTATEIKLTELGNAYAGNTHLTGIKLPDTITVISANAFKDCTALTYAEFEGELTEIGESAFEGCTAFAVFEIPASVIKIGANAFKGTGLSILTAKEGSQLAQIGDNAFDGTKLTSVNLSAATEIESFGAGAFANLDPKLEEGQTFTFTFPQSQKLTTLPNNLFENDLCLTEIEIPAYITTFATGVFKGCTNLTKLSFAEGSVISEFGQGSFTGLNITDLTLPDGVKTIGKAAFAQMTELEKITIPAGATIEAGTSGTDKKNMGAFTGCTALTDVTFKGTGVTVPDYTFYNCSKLANVNFENVKIIGLAAFYNTGFTSITLGANILSDDETPAVGKAAFATSTNLDTVNIATTVTLAAGTGTSTTSHGVFGGCTGLKTVTITGEDTVEILDYTFYGCTALATVDFAKVTSVGTAAFTSSALNGSLDLSTITSFGKAAFASSTQITEIKLSPAATCVDGSSTSGANLGVFGGCNGLTTVTFAESAENKMFSVPAYGFYGCTALSSFDFSKVSAVGKSAFQMGSFASTTKLNSNADDFKNITTIGDNAFYYFNVDAVNLSGATNIGATAFYGAENLKSVSFAEDAEELVIGKAAFAGSGLTSVTIPNGATLTAGTSGTGTSVGAFGNCTGLGTVTFANKVTSYEVPNYTFYGCTNLKTVEFTKISSIGNYAFSNCGFQNVELGANTTLGTYAFDGCAALTTVTLADGATIASIPNYAFRNCTSLTSFPFDKIAAPASATTFNIGSNAFESCTSLTSVTFANDVNINGSAFKGCTALKTVDFAHVKAISTSTFENCASLTEATAICNTTSTNATTKAQVPGSAFKGCSSLITVTIPADVKTIGTNAFQNCYKLVVVINNSANLTLTAGGTGNGDLTKYAKLVINSEGENTVLFKTTDEKFMVIKETAEEVATYSVIAYTGTDPAVVLPEKLTLDLGDEKTEEVTSYKLYDYLFYNSTAITSITIPASVKEIGASAFQNATKLKTVTITDEEENASKLTTIGASAFAGSGIESIIIPASVTAAGGNFPAGSSATTGVFSGCTSLETVTFKGTGVTVPAYAFNGCTALTTVNFANISSIGKGAFAKTGLTAVELVAGTTIEEGSGTSDGAFAQSVALTKVTFNSTDVKVPAYAFYGCTELATVNFANVSSIGKAAFYNTGFTTLSLSADTELYTATSTSDGVFSACAKLTEFGFIGNKTWTTIPKYFFYNCKVLTKFNASQTENVVLPAGLTEIGDNAFYATAIASVRIPASVTSIGANAFYNCASLATVEFEAPAEGVEAANLAIGNSAFSSTAITGITLPARVNSIGTNLFQNCASLQTADLTTANITALTQNTFRGCAALTTVKLPKVLAENGLDAAFLFNGCVELTDIWYEGDAVLTSPTKQKSGNNYQQIFAGGENDVTFHVKDATKYDETWGTNPQQFVTSRGAANGHKAVFVTIEPEVTDTETDAGTDSGEQA